MVQHGCPGKPCRWYRRGGFQTRPYHRRAEEFAKLAECVVLQLVQLCLRILAPGEQIGDIDPAVFRFEVGVFGPFVDVEAVALVYGRIARALFFVDKRFLSGYVVLGIVHARLSTRNQDIINPPGI